MTARDLCWRAGGAALLAAAGTAAVASRAGGTDALSPAWGVVMFAVAIAGAILLIQGRRVPLALRIERSAHRGLPNAIRAGRRRPASDRD